MGQRARFGGTGQLLGEETGVWGPLCWAVHCSACLTPSIIKKERDRETQRKGQSKNNFPCIFFFNYKKAYSSGRIFSIQSIHCARCHPGLVSDTHPFPHPWEANSQPAQGLSVNVQIATWLYHFGGKITLFHVYLKQKKIMSNRFFFINQAKLGHQEHSSRF